MGVEAVRLLGDPTNALSRVIRKVTGGVLPSFPQSPVIRGESDEDAHRLCKYRAGSTVGFPCIHRWMFRGRFPSTTTYFGHAIVTESKLGRTPPRYPPNPMQVSEHKTFRLKIATASEALLYIRYLMTEFYANGRKWSTSLEENSFFLAGEYFTGYSNGGFYDKHELDFLKVRSLARIVYHRGQGELPAHEEAAEKLLLSQRVLLNPRAFLGLKRRFRGGFLRVTNRQLRGKCPEPRRIGVGYRDKGTAQNPPYDASPGWQEVAVSRLNRLPLGGLCKIRWYTNVRFF